MATNLLPESRLAWQSLFHTIAPTLLVVFAVVIPRDVFGAQAPEPTSEEPNSGVASGDIAGRLTDRTLVVGTKIVPPFAMKNSDGVWTGISIELWRHLADELNFEFEFRELTLPEMLDKLENREIDAAVAAISVTADRHQRVEFCHPHFTTGLGVAVSSRNRTNPTVLLRRILTTRLLVIVMVMIFIVACCGILFWLFERRRNENLFGTKKSQGIGVGMWWSTVLLLGHKGIMPASTFGRLLAGSAMFSSILLMSLLTGVVTSVITIQQLDVGIKHPSDLRHMRVATVAASTSIEYLNQRRIPYIEFESATEALETLDSRRADAVVYDEALLKYLKNESFREVAEVLPMSFNRQEYAIALQPESEFRKPINGEVLKYRASDDWEDLVFRFLGE